MLYMRSPPKPVCKSTLGKFGGRDMILYNPLFKDKGLFHGETIYITKPPSSNFELYLMVFYRFLFLNFPFGFKKNILVRNVPFINIIFIGLSESIVSTNSDLFKLLFN